MKFISQIVIVFLLVLGSSLAIIQTVSAHGHVTVGDYELVIGFRSEPAIQGEPNGLELRVTNAQTGQPVSGLENSLQVEILFGASARRLALYPMFGQEGSYSADLIPTEAGDYTWHIFGDIEGTPVDVEMTSSPDTFSSVQPRSRVSFPGSESSASELADGIDGAMRTARAATWLGIAGLGVGLAALALSLLILRSIRR